jgi:TPR repeat protein
MLLKELKISVADNQLVRGSREYKAALKAMRRKEPDESGALHLLREAHKRGDPRAAYALATWYLFGKGGLRRNFRSAVKLLKESAKCNIAEAHFDLAVCYETGKGVKKNLKLAAAHYLNAAIRGDAEAVFAVGRCFHYGIGVAKDIAIAEVWLARAQELGTFQPERKGLA